MTTQEQVDALYALPAQFEYPEPRELTAEEMDAAADVLICLPLTWIAEGR